MQSLQGIRRALILLAAVGLVGRVFIPAGFMPAPLDGGWPVQLCPSLADGMLLDTRGEAAANDLHAHHGHHGPGEPAQEAEHAPPCPVGAFFASSAVVESGSPLVFVPEVAHDLPAADSLAVESVVALGAQPRGPPFELPLYA